MNKLTTTSLAFVTVMALGSIATSAFAKASTADESRLLAKSPIVSTTTADDELARRKPRVRGGSGCDDPQDVIEHPECRAALTLPKVTLEDLLARSKPRVPGGSGCDSPRDKAEHPECRG
jgi:hypothetical protein